MSSQQPHPAQQTYPAQQPYATQQPYGAPAQPRPNPFSGTPVTDWIRDAAAAVLLLASLALPWSLNITEDYGSSVFPVAATRVEVLLITLLSTLSISVGYLTRFGVFGPRFTAPRSALLRALLNLPYLLLVILYIVFDAVRLGPLGGLGIGPGLGPAVGVGLAGALLAAVPRRFEVLTPEFSATAARHGHAFSVGYLCFAAATALLGTVLSLVNVLQGSTGMSGTLIASSVTTSLLYALAPLTLAFFVVRRSEPARSIALAFGIAMVVGLFITAFASQSRTESVWLTFGYPSILTAGLAGVMSHAGLPYAMRRQQPITGWFATLKLAPVAAMIGLGYLVISSVAIIIVFQGRGIGYAVGVLICALLSLVAALILRMQLAANFLHSRPIAAGIAGGIGVAGLVAVILAGIHNSRVFDPTGLGLGASAQTEILSMASTVSSVVFGVTFLVNLVFAVFFGPVGLVLYGLFAPREVREYFADAATPAPAYATQQTAQTYQEQAYQEQAPVGAQQFETQPYPAQSSTVPVFEAPQQPAAPPAVDPAALAHAADPSTTPQEQFELAQRPELWAALAQNPALYDDLAGWLASTGDPQVLAALRAAGRLNG